MGLARAFMTRLRALCSEKDDPTLDRWVLLAESSIRLHGETKIGSSLKVAARGIEASKKIGDRIAQTTLLIYYSGYLFEIGEMTTAENVMREYLAISEQLKDGMAIILMKMSLANLLSKYLSDHRLPEIQAMAIDLMQLQADKWVSGTAYNILARIKHKQGNFEEAVTDARNSSDILSFSPIYGLFALVTLINALLAQGRVQEALPVAEEGLQRIRNVGTAGYNEVAMRLAALEAFAAAGDSERARAELRETLCQVKLRADDFAEPAWRNGYLTRNQDSVRALALAREWEIDVMGL
jgi:tetratricopeptide (TPR) repeat protein